ncbi:unnamed protein product [Plutella xylostella]|uniref:(diamondback moth) hypothetical protein n=1 Tax=Plutella xylostella TaxID=51655 RepID=A0A8S4FY07_PLUXY|nr:unnamed protein product [Plutella xylostella]
MKSKRVLIFVCSFLISGLYATDPTTDGQQNETGNEVYVPETSPPALKSNATENIDETTNRKSAASDNDGSEIIVVNDEYDDQVNNNTKINEHEKTDPPNGEQGQTTVGNNQQEDLWTCLNTESDFMMCHLKASKKGVRQGYFNKKFGKATIPNTPPKGFDKTKHLNSLVGGMRPWVNFLRKHPKEAMYFFNKDVDFENLAQFVNNTSNNEEQVPKTEDKTSENSEDEDNEKPPTHPIKFMDSITDCLNTEPNLFKCYMKVSSQYPDQSSQRSARDGEEDSMPEVPPPEVNGTRLWSMGDSIREWVRFLTRNQQAAMLRDFAMMGWTGDNDESK